MPGCLGFSSFVSYIEQNKIIIPFHQCFFTYPIKKFRRTLSVAELWALRDTLIPTNLWYCPRRFVGIDLHTLWKFSSGGQPILIHIPIEKHCKSPIIIIIIIHFYLFFKLPKNKFMIGIQSLLTDSGHKNTQSLDTIIKIDNDVSASDFYHSQI